MEIIQSKVELVEQEPGLVGMYKHIEKAGRVCYMSEWNIKEDSYKHFIENLTTKQHFSVLEQGTLYLYFNTEKEEELELCRIFDYDPYSIVVNDKNDCYVTTNYRVIVENKLFDLIKDYILDEPKIYHEKRFTFRVTTSIGVSREFNRHRALSISESSTRYCNYAKDKFNNKITYCLPTYYSLEDAKELNKLSDEKIGNSTEYDENIRVWMLAMRYTEFIYMYMINERNCKPQEARNVLPLSTATHIYYTGYERDWKHFLKLRTDKAAHPDMQEVANKIKELMPKY